MDNDDYFSDKQKPRLSESLAKSALQPPVAWPPKPENNTNVPSQQAADASQVRKPKSAPPTTRDDFTAANAPLQIKIPSDLIQSLRLHAIASGKSMSELALECLTSEEFLGKAWISTRKATA